MLLWRHPQVRVELLELSRMLRRPSRPPPHAAHNSPRRPTPDPRALQPHRDPRRVRPQSRGKSRRVAKRCLRSQERQRRAFRVHSRQEQRRLLPYDALPRLRHQPLADPLGEPVEYSSRQPDRPPLPKPRARRPLDPAVQPPPSRRPRLLVPRPGDLSKPRRREAHGHHLGASPTASRRPLCRLRRSRRVAHAAGSHGVLDAERFSSLASSIRSGQYPSR